MIRCVITMHQVDGTRRLADFWAPNLELAMQGAQTIARLWNGHLNPPRVTAVYSAEQWEE